MLDTEKKIVKVASHVDIFLKNYLKKRTENTQLFNALKYGLFSGGKKFRSYLIVTSGKLFNLNYKQLIAIGAAVECMHSYSLIHDDLPSMAVNPTEKQEEYIEDVMRGGTMINLDYDFEPSESFKNRLKMALEGDSKMGNSQEAALS